MKAFHDDTEYMPIPHYSRARHVARRRPVIMPDDPPDVEGDQDWRGEGVAPGSGCSDNSCGNCGRCNL